MQTYPKSRGGKKINVSKSPVRRPQPAPFSLWLVLFLVLIAEGTEGKANGMSGRTDGPKKNHGRNGLHVVVVVARPRLPAVIIDFPPSRPPFPFFAGTAAKPRLALLPFLHEFCMLWADYCLALYFRGSLSLFCGRNLSHGWRVRFRLTGPSL